MLNNKMPHGVAAEEPPVKLSQPLCHSFLLFPFRSVGEVTSGETAKRREELPHILSAPVWSLRRLAEYVC